MVGESLGPYSILEPLGAGGMGEVYLAEDTRLRRKVALKVLPPAFASDPERLARFEREARAAAALNHPHIAAVFDLGSEAVAGDPEAAATPFIVQEYLEGDTLRTLLKKGPLPLGRALALATEVGEALVAAHQAGIIHRDLKPENIFVTDGGHAKILDFGLAKLTEPDDAQAGTVSMSPTVIGTVVGQVMGTAGYMSPEQINGEEIDHRADLFAFCCVLYEMVCGRRAFEGETVLDTLHAIARTEPRPLAQIKPELPAELQRILRKGLAKDPGARYQSAADLVVDLKGLTAEVDSGMAVAVGNTGPSPRDQAERQTPRWSRGQLALLAIGPALITGLLVGALGWFGASAAPGHTIRFEIETPPYADSEGNGVLVSPDGGVIVFGGIAEGEGSQSLYVRRADSIEPKRLSGTGPWAYPFFSPDGEWLAFRRNDELVKASLAGGTPSVIHELPGPTGVRSFQGGTWSPEGWIVFSAAGALYRVPDDGSEPPRLIVEADPDLGELRHPDLLPGGHAVVVTLWRGSNADARIGVADLNSGQVRDLRIDGSDPQYLPTGHLVWVRGDSLLAAPFDVDSGEVTGSRGRVQQGIEVGPAGPGKLGISPSGTLAYSSAGASANFSLVWVDRQGNREPILAEMTDQIWSPRLSPDGRRIAIGRGSAAIVDAQVWIYDIDDETLNPLTTPSESSVANFPVWTPDGAALLYSADSGDGFAIYRKPADFIGAAELVTAGTPMAVASSLSPDGKEVALSRGGWPTAMDIAIAKVDASEVRAWLEGPFNEMTPMISPNGRWLAYVSDVSGEGQVYVRPYGGPGVRVQVSNDGGAEPRWRPDGRELFYRRGEAIIAVGLSTGDDFEIVERRQLFVNQRGILDRSMTYYDVDPRGERFLMAERGSGREAQGGVIVVYNWFEELMRRVPTSR